MRRAEAEKSDKSAALVAEEVAERILDRPFPKPTRWQSEERFRQALLFTPFQWAFTGDTRWFRQANRYLIWSKRPAVLPQASLAVNGLCAEAIAVIEWLTRQPFEIQATYFDPAYYAARIAYSVAYESAEGHADAHALGASAFLSERERLRALTRKRRPRVPKERRKTSQPEASK